MCLGFATYVRNRTYFVANKLDLFIVPSDGAGDIGRRHNFRILKLKRLRLRSEILLQYINPHTCFLAILRPASSPNGDCSICEEGFSRGFAYSCKKCSNTARGSAVALTLTVVMVALLLVAIRFRRWRTVVVERLVRESEIPRGLARSTCSSRQWWILKWIPLSAIKILVVVWQVIYEV